MKRQAVRADTVVKREGAPGTVSTSPLMFHLLFYVYALSIKAMLRARCLFSMGLMGLFLMLPSAAFGQQCIEDVFCVFADEHEGVVDFYIDNYQADDLIIIFEVDTENMDADVSFPHLAT